MVATARPSLTQMLPLAGAATAGALSALAAIVAPARWLEALAPTTGLAAVLPAAAPPLGVTARAVLALAGGGAVAAVVWAVLFLLYGPEGVLARPRRRAEGVPKVRRADAHPDAPPRRPFSAADLDTWPQPAPGDAPAIGLPLPVPAMGDLSVPADLDQPLAAFDPVAIPATPREPARPVPPLARGERLETFRLTPPPPAPRPMPEPPAEPPSIEALLRRLEQGAQRRTAAAR